MKDISVEYAHIYTNSQLGDEQRTSLEILSAFREECKGQNKTLSMAIMIDDYSFPDPLFDYALFAAELETAGLPPDVTVRESQLIPLCDLVLTQISNEKVRDPIVDYIKAKKKYPCSLFIAAWYLARLGHLKTELVSADHTARALVNILPQSFKPFEDAGFEIIAATPFAASLTNINNRYFAGRLIA